MYRKRRWGTATQLHQIPTDSVETDVVGSASLAPANMEVFAPAPAQPKSAETAAVAPPDRSAPRRLSRRAVALGAGLALAVGVAGWFGYGWWTVGRFTVATDDAYVQAYNTTLAAKVSGYVASVTVTDNMRVHAGDMIATLDDGDYRLAVDSAREKVATQEAIVARMAHQITAQEAAVAQAKT